MKRILSTLLLIIASMHCACALDRTDTVAAQKGYPRFMINLRNKAQLLLNQEAARMKLNIQELHQKDLDLRAYEMGEQYKKAYLTLEERVNATFSQLSDEFIRGAENLDFNQAPIKQKQEFIDKMKRKAREQIDDFLRKTRRIARNNPLNVDI